MTIRVVPPISDARILPTVKVTSGQVSKELYVVASRGEYEPASFVVTADASIEALQVRSEDLKGLAGRIQADRIDIRAVKSWYQSGSKGEGAAKELGNRVLVPALLLKDDSLIKVDYDKKQNYLKVPNATGEKYIWISNPDEKEGDNPGIPSDRFPLKDSKGLLPVNIAANTNKQFWVTVHVPESARPGQYSGRIVLSSAKGSTHLTLNLQVLPFTLLKPYYTSSIFYNNPAGYEIPVRYRSEMANLIAHGVTNPIYYPSGSELDETFMRIRKEIGMAGQPHFTIQNGVDPSPDKVRKYVQWARSYGFTDVYFYGLDEAHTTVLEAEVGPWRRTREAGGRNFASGAQEAGSKATYGNPDSYFRTVGDSLDIFINIRPPSREQAALWHSRGQRIWSYGNPHSGHDDPVVYRRNYGLLIWKNNYDGVGIFAYQFNIGNPYNDFDGPMRDLNFTYPTSDGVIDTIAWEAYREGVDDVRYVTTLAKAIESANSSGDARRKKTAADARRFLDKLDIRRDLDEIRREMIVYLVSLGAP